MKLAALLLLLLPLANPPFEGASLKDHELLCVWMGREGDTRRVHGEAWFDKEPERVVAALSDWERLGALLPDTKTYAVRERAVDKARIYRMQDTPPFFPEVWVEADATVVKEGEVTRIRLARRAGTPKVFVMQWEVSESPAGSLVRYRLEVQPPFAPPAFMLERMQLNQVAEHVERLRERLDAKVFRPRRRCD